MNWFYDQQFSSRPSIFASYIATVVLQNHDEAVNITRMGLTSNPGDFGLLNNLTYALASSGNIDEAEKEFSKIKKGQFGIPSEVIWLATKGMICFRKFNIVEGRSLYQQAIDRAKGETNKRMRAMASVFFAYEEMRINGEKLTEVYNQALNNSKGLSYPELNLMLNRIKEFNL